PGFLQERVLSTRRRGIVRGFLSLACDGRGQPLAVLIRRYILLLSSRASHYGNQTDHHDPFAHDRPPPCRALSQHAPSPVGESHVDRVPCEPHRGMQQSPARTWRSSNSSAPIAATPAPARTVEIRPRPAEAARGRALTTTAVAPRLRLAPAPAPVEI